MNAAVHAFEDLNFAVDDDSPPASQQRQLANELARVRTKRASVEHELREIDRRAGRACSAARAPSARRRCLHGAGEARGRGRRQAVLGRRNVLGACSRAVAAPRAPASPSWASGSATWKAARRRCASRSGSSTTRSTRSSVRCSKCSTRKSSSATNGRSSARSTRSRATRFCPGRTTSKTKSASASPPRSRCCSPCCSACSLRRSRCRR